MHNNFITYFMNLLDLVATDLIKTGEYLIFIADYIVNHVKCPILSKKVNKLLNRRVQSI